MRFRRHIPAASQWKWTWPSLGPNGVRRWALALAGAVLAGYLTAYLVVFPSPIWRSRQVVPRVLGLALEDASRQLREAGFQIQDGGSEPHPTAPQGTVIWQDPPPGVSAPAGLRVTLVASGGPPKIPVPDVAGPGGAPAQRPVAAAGMTLAPVVSVQARRPAGGAMMEPPAAATVLGPGAPRAEVVAGGADWLHVDVMDGRFVPNLTFGAGMIEALRKLTDKPLDVHLMVVEPERYIEPFAAAGASVFTFHPEATTHVQRHLAAVRGRGMLAGLALNPGSPLALAAEVIADLDLLLIMTVNPGFGGQTYLPASDDKIRRARELIAAHGSRAFLEVDGGITRQTIAAAHAAGADTFVTGNAVFASADPGREVQELRRRCLVTV